MYSDKDTIDGISVKEIKQFPVARINNNGESMKVYVNKDTGVAYMATEDGELTGQRGTLKEDALKKLLGTDGTANVEEQSTEEGVPEKEKKPSRKDKQEAARREKEEKKKEEHAAKEAQRLAAIQAKEEAKAAAEAEKAAKAEAKKNAKSPRQLRKEEKKMDKEFFANLDKTEKVRHTTEFSLGSFLGGMLVVFLAMLAFLVVRFAMLQGIL